MAKLKITDHELRQAIWVAQLNQLAGGVLDHYIGDRYGVCDDKRHSFEFTQALAYHRCQEITTVISKGQLRKRIRKIVNGDHGLNVRVSDNRFMFDTPKAERAFKFSRCFWALREIPTGYDTVNERMRTATGPDIERLTKELKTELIRRYGGSYE